MILTRLNNAADGKDGQRVQAHKLWNPCITLKSGECQSVRNFDMKFLTSRRHFSKILNLFRSKHLVAVDCSPQSVAGEVLRRLLEDYKANVKLLTKAQSGQWCLSVFERRDKMGPYVEDHTRHKPNRIESSQTFDHPQDGKTALQIAESAGQEAAIKYLEVWVCCPKKRCPPPFYRFQFLLSENTLCVLLWAFYFVFLREPSACQTLLRSY